MGDTAHTESGETRNVSYIKRLLREGTIQRGDYNGRGLFRTIHNEGITQGENYKRRRLYMEGIIWRRDVNTRKGDTHTHTHTEETT